MYKILVSREVEVCLLKVEAGVRYWEDSTVNGVEDTEGALIPCREGKYWKPVIELETGKIINWKQGVEASIHYKVCDDGEYTLIGKDGHEVKQIEGYVPKIMCIDDDGFGDYIIMKVDKDGFIKSWRVILDEFTF